MYVCNCNQLISLAHTCLNIQRLFRTDLLSNSARHFLFPKQQDLCMEVTKTMANSATSIIVLNTLRVKQVGKYNFATGDLHNEK